MAKGEPSGLLTRTATTGTIFVVRADEKFTVFMALESAIRACLKTGSTSRRRSRQRAGDAMKAPANQWFTLAGLVENVKLYIS